MVSVYLAVIGFLVWFFLLAGAPLPGLSDLHDHLAGVAAGEQQVERVGRLLEALDDGARRT